MPEVLRSEIENISNSETVYRCRAVGQMSTIHSLVPKEDLNRSVHNVDVFYLFSVDPYSVYRLVEIHISDANQQAFRKYRGK